MNQYSVCGNCKYFTQALQSNYGTCSNQEEKVCILDINHDDCEHFEVRTKKSKDSGYKHRKMGMGTKLIGEQNE